MTRSDKFKKVLASEEAKAVVAKYIPDFFKDSRVKMAGILSIQAVVDRIPAESLSEENREALLQELEVLS
jgi:hypothetical protein